VVAVRLPDDDGEEVVPSMEMEGVLLLNVAVVLITAGAITSGDADGDAAGQSSAPTYAMQAINRSTKQSKVTDLNAPRTPALRAPVLKTMFDW
jgi:dihydroxyacid dehydratase/phosphogluconate dehydratase